MPYISKEARDRLDKLGERPRTTGELNYCITKLLIEFCRVGYDYSDLNDIIGAVEAAKQEFYRRMVIPYENTKIIKNGDVYFLPRS